MHVTMLFSVTWLFWFLSNCVSLIAHCRLGKPSFSGQFLAICMSHSSCQSLYRPFDVRKRLVSCQVRQQEVDMFAHISIEASSEDLRLVCQHLQVHVLESSLAIRYCFVSGNGQDPLYSLPEFDLRVHGRCEFVRFNSARDRDDVVENLQCDCALIRAITFSVRILPHIERGRHGCCHHLLILRVTPLQSFHLCHDILLLHLPL